MIFRYDDFLVHVRRTCLLGSDLTNTSCSIQSLLIFFGPILAPKILAFYRSIRAPSKHAPNPLPASAARSLNLLFFSALVFLISTLPIFTPANIFQQTQSRVQTPTLVLFTRLSALHALTPTETTLSTVFAHSGLDVRLLYLRFGPNVLASAAHITPLPAAAAQTAPASAPDAVNIYLLHALPSLLGPHLLHLLVLGLVTSPLLTSTNSSPSPAAPRFRTPATIAGLVLAAADLAATATYDHHTNALATRSSDLVPFFWRARLFSRLAVVGVDAALGWILYLTATGRILQQPEPAAQRVEAVAKELEAVLGKMRGLGAVRNVVARDTGLRGRVEGYWVREQEVMRQVWEEREVLDAFRGAVEAADLSRLGSEAEGYVGSVLGVDAEVGGGQAG